MVQLKNDYRADMVTLFDLSGKLLASKKNIGGLNYIGSNLSKGVYTVTLKCEKKIYSQKVMVP